MNKEILTKLNDNFTIAELVAFIDSYGKWDENSISTLLQDIKKCVFTATVDLILKNTGEKKIHVIKAMRSFTSLGLKEAKEIADSAWRGSAGPDPIILKEVSLERAQEGKKLLEEQGATAKIVSSLE